MNLKNKLLFVALMATPFAFAKTVTVDSPNRNLKVEINDDGSTPTYSVIFKDKVMLEKSPLGFKSDLGDYTVGVSLQNSKTTKVKENYSLKTIKKSDINYEANKLVATFSNKDKQTFDVIFQVSNNDIAFRYFIPKKGEPACVRILEEATGFKFPQNTTTFLSEQMLPMGGFKRTTPSYEAGYHADRKVGQASGGKNGWIMPALFKIAEDGWVLIAETGVDSNYCGSKLSEPTAEGLYKIAFPNPHENNSNGTVEPAMGLPAYTPWRTITVGDTLKPIVETTIAWDVVKPLFKASQKYKYGRGSWSWIVWQDASMNWNDQVKYIDLAAAMNFEYILIDAWWDKNIGREKMAELIKYANSKNVDVFLWYTSSGYWNDIEMTPANRMSNHIQRKEEMQWLKSVGAKGIKVDFFGGDKQETMRLYEAILSDANDAGIMVTFHGCTMPRGWERMYPNYAGSEAVIASEALIFGQWACDNMSYFASMHPFVRNTTGSMEFGGTFMNKFMNKGNKSGNKRKTSDAAELAIQILFQNPVQFMALTPNNLEDAPKICLDFLRNSPTIWQDTQYIAGYPSKFSAIARKSNGKWYFGAVSAINNLSETINLKMFAGKAVNMICDGENGEPVLKKIKIPRNGKFDLKLKKDGGLVIFE